MWSEGEGRLKVWCTMTRMGEGIVFCLGGGEKTHIGAISLAVPYKKKDGEWSVSVSTITLPAHRDDVLTRIIAEKVARVTGSVVVAVGGVHVEAASEKEINEIISNTERLAEKVAVELRRCKAANLVD